MSLMVRVRENSLTEVNIQWNHKEKRMQREEENVLGLAVGTRDRFCKTWGWDRKPFDDNELLAGRGCCLFITAFLAPSAGVGGLYVELIWSQSLNHFN